MATLITAEHVYAGDPPRPTATALLVEGDRIAWVGDVAGAPDARRRVDLRGARVVPGFVDPHLHFIPAVLDLHMASLEDASTVAEVQDLMRAQALRVPEGGWVAGWGYRELVDGADRPLDRWALDEAVPDRPALVMFSSYHAGVGNSAALAAVGFGRRTPRSTGGELERDRRGEPNGRVWERAFGVLENAAHRSGLTLFVEGWDEAVRRKAREFLAAGITHTLDAAVRPIEMERLHVRGMPVGLTVLPVGSGGFYGTPADALDGPRTGEGDPSFLVGPVKLFADGGERCAMRLPLRAAGRLLARLGASEGPSVGRSMRNLRVRVGPTGIRTGTLHYPPGGLRRFVRRAHARGFSVAIHALGNDGVEDALGALEAGGRGGRIEHAAFVSEKQAERIARAGITVVMQPGHLWSYGRMIGSTGVADYLPPVPVRRMLDAGVHVALSSDAPTAIWEPLAIMRAAVDRLTSDGEPLSPDQAVTPEEALRAATVTAAEAAGVGELKGRIAPGRQADLAVLSGDPVDQGTTVRETWVAGRRAWPDPS